MTSRDDLVRFIAKSRVMNSFLPDDDDRSKNEYVADELIAAGFTDEVTGEMVGRAWVACRHLDLRPTVEQVRAILEAALTIPSPVR